MYANQNHDNLIHHPQTRTMHLSFFRNKTEQITAPVDNLIHVGHFSFVLCIFIVFYFNVKDPHQKLTIGYCPGIF